MTMLINGAAPLAHGSLMIPPGVNAGFRLPGGDVSLRFDSTGKEGFVWNNWVLTITAPNSPLGIALDVPLNVNDGRNLKLALTVHTVGEGPGTYRICHYTAYLA